MVVYLVLTPLGMLIWNSLKTTPPGVPGPLTLENFTKAYFDPTLYPLMANSLVFAVGSTLFAFFFAFVMAWLVERTNTPLRDLAYVIAIVSTIIPGMTASIAWIMLLHPRIGLINLALVKTFGLSEAPINIHSMYGMIFVGGVTPRLCDVPVAGRSASFDGPFLGRVVGDVWLGKFFPEGSHYFSAYASRVSRSRNFTTPISTRVF